MHRLPASVAKRCVVLKREASATQAAIRVVLLPYDSQKSSNKRDIIDVMSLCPQAVVVDTCETRMVKIAKYVQRFEAPFQPHSMMQHMRGWPITDTNFVCCHLILENLGDLPAVARSVEGMTSSLNTVPGAELNLALQLSQSQKCKFFYCLDSHVSTLIHRIYQGMTWREMYTFTSDLDDVVQAGLRRDEGEPQPGDRELLQGAPVLVQREYPWLHQVAVVERAKIIGMRLKELCAQPPDISAAEARGGEEGRDAEAEAAGCSASDGPFTVAAFINRALLPGIVSEWCTDRTHVDTHALHAEFTARSRDLVRGGMFVYAAKAKQLRKEHEQRCAEAQESPEQRLVKALNEHRGVRFDSAYPFQEADLLPHGAKLGQRRASAGAGGGGGQEEGQGRGTRRSSHAPSPFDIMSDLGSYDVKSASHSRLRR